MTNKEWHVLRVRQGFEEVVAHRLRGLDLEVFVPRLNVSSSEDRNPGRGHSAGYVYCRFSNHLPVTSIPGVLYILGTSEPVFSHENEAASELEYRWTYPPEIQM